MNLRETFNKVKEHLLAQNCAAIRSDGACLYRGPDGTKCAVGCLISDEVYDPAVEGMFVGDVPVRHLLELSGVDLRHKNAVGMLLALQVMHDEQDVSEWAEELDRIEKNYVTHS